MMRRTKTLVVFLSGMAAGVFLILVLAGRFKPLVVGGPMGAQWVTTYDTWTGEMGSFEAPFRQ